MLSPDDKRKSAFHVDEHTRQHSDDADHMNQPVGGDMAIDYLPAPDNGETGNPLPDPNRKAPYGY